MPKFEVTGTLIENFFIVVTADSKEEALQKADDVPRRMWNPIGEEFTVDYADETVEEEN